MGVVMGDDGDNIQLPQYIMLENNKVMRLRRFEAVVRRHKFNPDRCEHEFFFSEMLLFSPWRDEAELYPDNLEQCARIYLYKREAIECVKKTLFPHLKDVEL